MAKSVAAKGAAKKKNRKLKRQIRKTVGALLMVSAIAVAAVPVPDVSAYPYGPGDSNVAKSEKIKVAVTSEYGAIKTADVEREFASTIPYVKDVGAGTNGSDEIIYTSGDGAFKFAYIGNVGNKEAIILQYTPVSTDGNLIIPDTLEAYRQYADNRSSDYYCLVSISDELLYYKTSRRKTENNKFVYRTLDRRPQIIITQDASGNKVENGALDNIEVTDVKDGKYTYEQTVTDNTAENGPVTTTRYVDTAVEEVWEDAYQPCYFRDINNWKDKADNELYFIPKTNDGKDSYDMTKIEQAVGSEHWRIVANVAYIGGEKVIEHEWDETMPDGSTEKRYAWKIGDPITAPDDGVFANRSSITNLTMSDNLRGVSDYAFYRCQTLSSVKFSSKLETLGNGAFAECINLLNVDLASNADLNAIGKDAFYDCRSLTSFTTNVGLKAIGDCAFEGCTNLSTFNFAKEGEVGLQVLGNHIFRNCSALGGIEFPSHYAEELDIDMFQGCKSLQFIRTENSDLTFNHKHTDNSAGNYPNCIATEEDAWKDFNNTVAGSFYFESPIVSELHDLAKEWEVTYKYPDEELYEKVAHEHDAIKDEKDPEGESARVLYRVDNTGKIVRFEILPYKGGAATDLSHPDVITIPEMVGTFAISTLDEGSFNNNSDLVKVTIPASVTTIGANVFKGCTNLKTVMFNDATTITEIGPDAFRTQDGPGGWGGTGDEPKLYFVGAMYNNNNEDTVPFQYAMNGSSKINNDNTKDLWITCHSGWPTNLEVEYHEEDGVGEAQLVGYPRMMPDGVDLNNDTAVEAWAKEWVNNKLPYVTNDTEKADYAKMVFNVAKGQASTPNESALDTAATNIVIPASVDSIKPGLFSGYTEGDDGEPKQEDTDYTPDTKLQRILINGVKEIEPYTFKGCTGLEAADIIGSEMLGNYAFDECESLKTVTLGTNLKDTGKRPFKGCEELTQINCLEGSLFRFNQSILYRTTDSGVEIVECLENRGTASTGTSYNVGPDELSGVTSVKPEAFAECDSIASIDMGTTSVREIPEGCFKEMDLNSIVLPDTLMSIQKDAFAGNAAKRLEVNFGKGNPGVITPDAFEPKNDDDIKREVYFICDQSPDSYPNVFAKDYSYIISTDKGLEIAYTVSFYNRPDFPYDTNAVLIPEGTQKVKRGEDAIPPSSEGLKCNDESLAFIGWTNYKDIQKDTEVYAIYGSPDYTVTFVDSFTNEQIGEPQKVKRGQNAIPPSEDLIPQHEGYMFQGWNPAPTNITGDTICRAEYIKNDGTLHKVTYCAYDGTVLTTYTVAHEEDAPNIQAPVRDGYTFTGWMPAAYLTKVTEDRTVVATYQQGGGGNAGPNPSGGNGNGNGNNPNPSGGNGNNGNNNNANSSSSPKNSATPTATPADGKDVPKYTVTVSGGSGTGSYPAGAVVAINAYAMGVGQVFDKWTSSTAGVGFADATATSTTFTMPAANVAITATYKTGGAGNAATNSSGGSGGGGGSSTGTVNNGSTVEVSKPGISNTNVAGATVTGATDNFVVKVSEDQAATDAATSALQARFGDLSRIKYFPMDISLYDSTGRTKIADTSGISVNLTLPLPDELIQYAGNNKMAAISGGALEDLNARFTTVGGVPCINFTATHFSPYVIYVDTANLTEATIDSTPKTGDPIHPKWFLAIGMACISLVLFFKRDKVVVKTKAA